MLSNKSVEIPLVSVCIPTFNRFKKLQYAIEAILNQTYPNIEIIISDNASADETEEYCLSLQTNHPNIKYFRQSNNIGPTANFEFAKRQVTGEYFLLHGDDDYLDRCFIMKCVQELQTNLTYALVSGLASYRKDGLESITHYGNIFQLTSNIPVLRVIKYLSLVEDNSVFCGVYRTIVLKSSFMPNVLGGDWIWISQVLLHGKAKVFDNIFVHRSYGDNASSSVEKIVQIINAPLWHAKWPWLAISSNFFQQLLLQQNISFGKKLTYAIISFIILITRGSYIFFKLYIIAYKNGFKSLLRRTLKGFNRT